MMAAPYPVGIRAVHWWSSASCLRILDRLACKGPAEPDTLAAELHNQVKYTYRLMSVVLHSAERVHVCGWRHNIQGAPTPIYAIGPGKDIPKPKPETASQRAKRRRRALNAKYGPAITEKLLNPGKYGYPQIHIDGQRIRTLHHGTQLAGRT